jgi:hypothetical protein
MKNKTLPSRISAWNVGLPGAITNASAFFDGSSVAWISRAILRPAGNAPPTTFTSFRDPSKPCTNGSGNAPTTIGTDIRPCAHER